jgi:hypothetical protein
MYSKVTESQVTHRNVLLVRNRHSTAAELRPWAWFKCIEVSNVEGLRETRALGQV